MTPQNNSTCQSLLCFLSDYIDGELSSELCEAISRHTSECENCRIVVDTLRKTISLYRDSAADDAVLPEEARSHLYKTLNLEDYLHH